MDAHSDQLEATVDETVAETERLLRRALERPADYRVLERLVIEEGETGEGAAVDVGVCAVIDVETTGLARADPVIELALRRFRYDADGVITRIDRPYSWRQDPGCSVSADITRLTGLRNEDLVGMEIDVEAASRLLNSASVICAHHARFDRPRVEDLLPAIKGARWACSMQEIGWVERGFDGRRLGPLLNACGKWHEAHRALGDVDAVVGLLRQRFDDGRTAMSVLLERASQPSWIIRAVGAHFDVKDQLKARGYRWDGDNKVWWTELYGVERDCEEWWLAANVYAVEAKPKALGPTFEEMDWTRRHG